MVNEEEEERVVAQQLAGALKPVFSVATVMAHIIIDPMDFEEDVGEEEKGHDKSRERERERATFVFWRPRRKITYVSTAY